MKMPVKTCHLYFLNAASLSSSGNNGFGGGGFKKLNIFSYFFSFLRYKRFIVNLGIMNRSHNLNNIKDSSTLWDIIVVGGGATGLGVALDAALRGYKTLLLEQSDFAKGTSSRSTKLVHGGVRYLAQGNVKLVFEALHERGLLLKNAPHVCYNQTFLIPTFSWWDGLKYTIGLKLYDWLSGSLSLGKSEIILKRNVSKVLPGIKEDKLVNGVVYHDGQFDDSRLAINIAQSAQESGAVVLNYMKVNALIKNAEGKVCGVKAEDVLSGELYELNAKVVVNATGVFVDQILRMDQPKKKASVKVSQGTHIVLDSKFLPGSKALMIPKTSDGRVLFAIPWHGKLVVGTTDIMVEKEVLDPQPTKSEVDFILETFNQYAVLEAKAKDIKAVFCGLRPLAQPSSEGKNTKDISRSHKLFAEESNLVTITGGKWTTYRKMAEDTVDLAAKVAQLPLRKCKTEQHKIHGYKLTKKDKNHLSVYGSDAEEIDKICVGDLKERIHPDYPFFKAEVVWAVRNEMAVRLEDILARRIRLLFIDVNAALEVAPMVAKLMAKEMNQSEEWVKNEVEKFNAIAKTFLPF